MRDADAACNEVQTRCDGPHTDGRTGQSAVSDRSLQPSLSLAHTHTHTRRFLLGRATVPSALRRGPRHSSMP